MDKLISDRASVEISNRVQDILCSLVIEDWQSEPHYQHQNYAERHRQELKKFVHRVMDSANAPPECWALCCHYCGFILNWMSSPTLNDDTPYFRLHSQLPDISMIPNFTFYQGVYYQHHASGSESIIQTREAYSHFVGFAENVGHTLTYKILTSSQPRIVVFHSKIRACVDREQLSGRNLRAENPPAPSDAGSLLSQHDPGEPNTSLTGSPSTPGEHIASPADTTTPPFTLWSPYDTKLAEGKLLPTFDPEDIVGKSFLLPPKEDGTCDTATFTEMIKEYQDDVDRHPDLVKFTRYSVSNEVYDNLISYAQALEYPKTTPQTIRSGNSVVSSLTEVLSPQRTQGTSTPGTTS
jgi:hypothetical protein